MSSVILEALIYSLIAFSIVFIVLGGLTAVIFATRFLGDSNDSGDSEASGEKKPSPATVSPPPSPPVLVPAAVAVNANAHHVAAITSAILTMTQGRGWVRSIAPAEENLRKLTPDTTKRWREAGILEGKERRLEPTWKR